jgi:hypothetical protein
MTPAHRFTSRAVGLVICAGVGAALAAAGWLISGHEAWALAVPACIAVGWLFVADPTACERPTERKTSGVD